MSIHTVKTPILKTRHLVSLSPSWPKKTPRRLNPFLKPISAWLNSGLVNCPRACKEVPFNKHGGITHEQRYHLQYARLRPYAKRRHLWPGHPLSAERGRHRGAAAGAGVGAVTCDAGRGEYLSRLHFADRLGSRLCAGDETRPAVSLEQKPSGNGLNRRGWEPPESTQPQIKRPAKRQKR